MAAGCFIRVFLSQGRLHTQCVVLLLFLFSTNVLAQDPWARQYRAAYESWDAGDYPVALQGFVDLLSTPDGDQYVRTIALLTGELYKTQEVAPDGRNLQWSPEGRIFAFETGEASERQIHIVPFEHGRIGEITHVSGFGLTFSPDGEKVAYLTLEVTEELSEVYARMDSLREARDYRAFVLLRRNAQRVEAENARLWVYDMEEGLTTELEVPDVSKGAVTFGSDSNTLYLVSGPQGDDSRTNIYSIEMDSRGSTDLRQITDSPGAKSNLQVISGSDYLMYTSQPTKFVLYDISKNQATTFEGMRPAFSADGSSIVFVSSEDEENKINLVTLAGDMEPKHVYSTESRIDYPALSPDGSRIAFQMMVRDDWDLYVIENDGTGEIRLTRDIQHDQYPQFLSNESVLGKIGEGRHRRSYLYDARSEVEREDGIRLFHNNSVRTVAPEYDWAPSPDGSTVLIVSDRDGNTISPERAVYVVDLNRKVSRDEVIGRLEAGLEEENGLRARGRLLYEPIADEVQDIVSNVSVSRIYRYEKELFDFDSKFITEPGNKKAIEYLTEMLASFGYEPEQQWFEPRPDVNTANVVATLEGTVTPEQVIIVGSHFDSVIRGSGADDNSSGTAALLEAARVLAEHPLPSTVQFVFFTGEEAGLYGSREYVRRAVENDVQLVGALNNDMFGWTPTHRLDNTIRYSNDGIRDVQHAAAFLFTDLITYDARYYRGTDAMAFYEQYGDIVSGIGSYPILGNPHYHQSHDILETVNHQLVAEVSKATVASLMLMASLPVDRWKTPSEE